ncbi:tumor necrosis factor alpha-induced protein 2 [Puma concolor]|uniref:Tumor necrosis factor alpha-induced protein 2 n=1 Tax=Puma concolor TaxID=9696 RepID=A0A6P6HHC3_PUMCO|nr:tumor necrosis factor alpha-induced protein 2 [Puma concolor]
MPCEGGSRSAVLAIPWSLGSDIINSPKLAGELQRLNLGSLLPPRQIRLLEATFLSNEMRPRRLQPPALQVRLELLRCGAGDTPSAGAREGASRAPGPGGSGSASSRRGGAKPVSPALAPRSPGCAPALPGAPPPAPIPASSSSLSGAPLASWGGTRSSEEASDMEASDSTSEVGGNLWELLGRSGTPGTVCWPGGPPCLHPCPSRTAMQQKWQTQDLPGHLLGPLSELKSHGFDTLLQSLFGDLKPLFKRFTQTRWAAPAQTLEEIISTVGERLPEFSELHDCFREELMEVVHLHLVKEYIVRLSKRSLVLKSAEQQQQLAGHILANAELIQCFCTQNGSPATWLHHALPKLAEIIRLQDPSAIKIEVATYATWYPDFSKGHLSAILAIKGNLSSSEVKSIRSILDVSTGTHEPFKSLFSLIKVG